MNKIRARYRDGKLELEQPLNLPNGAEVEVEVRPMDGAAEAEAWGELGMARLEEEWDNPQDAIYDDWKRLYGV